MIVGVNEHMAWDFQRDDGVRHDILDKMKSWGATSIRLDYAWGTLEPSKGNYQWAQLDKFVGEADSRGLTVLLMLYWPPSWSSGSSSKNGVPSNPADFGNILGKTAQRYGSKLAALEMWNEPDLDGFWSGSNNAFFNLLAGAYPVAKGMAPDTVFLAAAPTYLGLATDWFAEAYTHSSYRPGVSYDGQAIHPYMSPADLPPNAPASDWSLLGVTELQALRSSYGDESPMFATEFGWSTHSNTGGEANHQKGITEAQHAEFCVAAFAMMAAYGLGGAWIYTDCDMAQTAEPHERNFGLLRTDYSEKPVIQALRDAWQGGHLPEPPDPGTDDTEQRIAALEAQVAALLAQDAELAANLQEAAHDLA